MAEELRSCRRTGCRWPAAASLSYQYSSRQVWLADLVGETHPALYDLCPHHADHLTLPRGWQLLDQRTAPEIIVEPAAKDRVPEPIPAALRHADDSGRDFATAPPDSSHVERPEGTAQAEPTAADELGADPGSDASDEHMTKPADDVVWEERSSLRANRYDVLVEELPRLAARLAEHSDRPEATGGGGPVPSAPSVPSPGGPARTDARRPGGGGGAPRRESAHPPQIRGQLAIPVEDLPPLGGPAGAVVVSIERAGARRRDLRNADL